MCEARQSKQPHPGPGVRFSGSLGSVPSPELPPRSAFGAVQDEPRCSKNTLRLRIKAHESVLAGEVHDSRTDRVDDRPSHRHEHMPIGNVKGTAPGAIVDRFLRPIVYLWQLSRELLQKGPHSRARFDLGGEVLLLAVRDVPVGGFGIRVDPVCVEDP